MAIITHSKQYEQKDQLLLREQIALFTCSHTPIQLLTIVWNSHSMLILAMAIPDTEILETGES